MWVYKIVYKSKKINRDYIKKYYGTLTLNTLHKKVHHNKILCSGDFAALYMLHTVKAKQVWKASQHQLQYFIQHVF